MNTLMDEMSGYQDYILLNTKAQGKFFSPQTIKPIKQICAVDTMSLWNDFCLVLGFFGGLLLVGVFLGIYNCKNGKKLFEYSSGKKKKREEF